MRRLIFGGTLFAILAGTALVSAQATAPAPAQTTPAQNPFTEEEKARARAELASLTQLFQVDLKAAEQSDHKTMADVADRALTLTSNAVGSIAKVIEDVAPHVWRIFIVQQYVKAVVPLVLPLGVMFIAFFAARAIRKRWPAPAGNMKYFNHDSKDNPLTERGWHGLICTVAPLVVIAGAGYAFFLALSQSAGYVINPEYYAVRDLVQLLMQPSTFVR